MESIGRLLFILGGVLLLLGVLFTVLGRVPGIGRLPGDIVIQRGNFTLYFPLATTIILSLVLSVLLTLVLRLFRS
jgi:hypothetical protein